MKLKGVLLAGVALAVVGFSSAAEAKDRITLYEINTFINELTNAVNNPNPVVGRSFLLNNVSATASFNNTMNRTWLGTRYAYNANYAYPVWYGNQLASPYYRYPYAYGAHTRTVGYTSIGKAEKVAALDSKKASIPRYHQSMTILASKMPADASSAVVDVNLKEFGLAYGYAPYGTHYGHKVQHTNANCQLHLKKNDGTLLLTRMTCNTNLHAPI